MSDLWLNPALLRQARGAAARPISGEITSLAFDAAGLQEASRFVPDLAQDQRPPAAAARRRRAFTRQLCLRLAALALLGGSAAFSYVAWSDEMYAGRAYGERSTGGEMNTSTRLAACSP